MSSLTKLNGMEIYHPLILAWEEYLARYSVRNGRFPIRKDHFYLVSNQFPFFSNRIPLILIRMAFCQESGNYILRHSHANNNNYCIIDTINLPSENNSEMLNIYLREIHTPEMESLVPSKSNSDRYSQNITLSGYFILKNQLLEFPTDNDSHNFSNYHFSVNDIANHLASLSNEFSGTKSINGHRYLENCLNFLANDKTNDNFFS